MSSKSRSRLRRLNLSWISLRSLVDFKELHLWSMQNEKFLLKSLKSESDEYLHTWRQGRVQLIQYHAHLCCPAGKFMVSYSHKGLGNHQIICWQGSKFSHGIWMRLWLQQANLTFSFYTQLLFYFYKLGILLVQHPLILRISEYF